MNLNTTREERQRLLSELTEARSRWNGSPFQSMEHSFSVDACKLLQDSLTVEDELARVRSTSESVIAEYTAKVDKLREELELARETIRLLMTGSDCLNTLTADSAMYLVARLSHDLELVEAERDKPREDLRIPVRQNHVAVGSVETE